MNHSRPRPIRAGASGLTASALAIAFFVACLAPDDAAAEPVSFRRDIAPLLLDQCLACHGPKKAEGGYRVDTYARAIAAGDSELAAFTASQVEESEAFRRIASNDEAERMPLEGQPVPPGQVALFKKWIEEGAKFDGEEKERELPLATLVPAPTHPKAPEQYPHTLPVTAVAFTPDGQRLIASGYHELTVWSVADGKLLSRIENVGQRTYALTAHPDGKRIVAASGDPGRLGEARLFDIETGKLLRVYGAASDVALDAQFTPDGKQLAMAAADSAVRIFDTESGELLRTVTSHSDWILALAWNADGTLLASGSRDKTAKVFDVKNGELKASYAGHAQPVNGVAFHPDGAQVYSSGADNKVHLWKIADGKKASELAFGGPVFKLPQSAGFLFAPSADKSVRQLDAKTNKELKKYEGNADWALCAAYHADTKRVASGGFDGQVHVWNAEDGMQLLTFTAAPGKQATAAP